MKKIFLFIAFMISCGFLSAQQPDSLDARLYLPVDQPNLIPADAKLIVHYVGEDKAGKPVTYKAAALRIAKNIYRFPMERFVYYRMIFQIGGFTYNFVCIDNRKGQAGSVKPFDIPLEKNEFDPKLLKLVPPCFREAAE
jgi:hypothetical protein